MNLQKIFIAAAGMALLAGLALHQGNNQRQESEDDSMLVGTAIDVPVQPQEIQEAGPETAQSEQPECSDETGLAAQGLDSGERCAPAEDVEDVSREVTENLKG